MPDRPLTLMAVHAHPDDEATGTGGVLARYAAVQEQQHLLGPVWPKQLKSNRQPLR